ncbi:MAG: penicillin-binding protein [Actinobacteria bacterium]|nr:MAG: penicillin-binding protein [Actinomycetota bacterium]
MVKAVRKARRRARFAALIAVIAMLLGAGLAVGAYYFDSVPTPTELALPQSTTVYYADGKTPMAKLGVENRTILTYDEINDAVKQSIVAAEDRTFWTNKGIDFWGVLRAAWNNVSGGQTQGASTITQQYARVAADLKGVTVSRKLREAVIAWKLQQRYSKQQILEFYLNTVPFGRGAYGIEAAAQAYFGKTANRTAAQESQITVAEAMVLVSMVKQPEPDPADPEGHPGYDPTRSARALENSKARWEYVRQGMVALHYLTPAQADALRYPDTVRKFDPTARESGLDQPTGLVVDHVLSELRQTDAFKGKPKDYIQNGGFQIVTTIDKRVQDIAEASADIRRNTAPAIVRGQPKNWQAALVAVEPGTGRVLGYYGGSGSGATDYAGWYYDADGTPTGRGEHPPGSSFKVYDLAEALHQKVSPKSHWDSPAVKEFPNSGRTNGSPNGPVRNSGSAPCQPDCTLWQATAASLNVTFFDLTEHLGVANVIDMAKHAGVDSIWANQPGQALPVRVDLREKSGQDVAGQFSTEVGIGQYGITVLDHANGMATFAAGGKRADTHFVRSVTQGTDTVYTERIVANDVGLDQEQIDELNWTLSKVEASKLNNGWDVCGKTGTWQYGNTPANAHTWMVGYTRALAAAAWLGTTDGGPLIAKDGNQNVFGANYPGAIWRQFMTQALAALKLDPNKYRFEAPKWPDESSSTGPGPTTTPSPGPSGPSPSPSCPPADCPKTSPSPSRSKPKPTVSPSLPSPKPTLPTIQPPGAAAGP